MKRYLLSIDDVESSRLHSFFAQSTFQHERKKIKVFGIIGKNLTASEYFTQAVVGKSKAMTPGELGCTLSHLAALKDFLLSDDDYAIIFEDDAIERFTVDFVQLERELRAMQLPECFFFSLGGIQLKVCNRVRGHILSKTLLDQTVLQIDPDFLENLSYAYAYVVDRAMATLLLQYHQPPRVYDHWQALTEQKTVFTFYASYIFDHPNIDQASHLSYLEQERNFMQVETPAQSSFLQYVRKKLKKYFLKKYKALD